ncbi:MAG TPA: GDSL-type esterase/lipase family protein [Chroococcales cyanobacterium]
MSDPYLLAASLITAGGPIPVPPPPTLPPTLPNSFSALFASTATGVLQSAVTNKIVPILEIASPEFSQFQANAAEARQPTASEFIPPVLTLPAAQAATEQVTDLQTLPKPQPIASRSISGSQMYLQRLAALKAGKTYTRLKADSFQTVGLKGTSTDAMLLQQPTHEQWIRLLDLEAKAIAKGQGSNRLSILLGDSLSMWFPSEWLPYGQLWLNQGISGENTSQILKRLSAFSQTRPDTIYVMAGTNDLRQGVSDRVILNNLSQILRRLRQNHPQAKVVVQSILPMRLPAIPNERIRNLNQQIAIVARQQGAGYLNLNSLFADEQGEMRQELTTDGIHLTLRGYEVWQEALNYAESVLTASRSDRVAQGLGIRN